MRWRNPDLQEVIDYLSHPKDNVKANAAAYLQHVCYMNDDIKAKTRFVPTPLCMIIYEPAAEKRDLTTSPMKSSDVTIYIYIIFCRYIILNSVAMYSCVVCVCRGLDGIPPLVDLLTMYSCVVCVFVGVWTGSLP
jgi:hypothetical protein